MSSNEGPSSLLRENTRGPLGFRWSFWAFDHFQWGRQPGFSQKSITSWGASNMGMRNSESMGTVFENFVLENRMLKSQS